MNSELDWEGLKSQKFSGGRLHIRPKDEIGKVIVGKDILFGKGKKHYNPKLSKEQQQNFSLKTFDIKNKHTYSYDEQILSFKKLPYIPPQRKAKLDALEQMGSKGNHSEKDKYYKRIGMMTFRKNLKYEEEKQKKIEEEKQKSSLMRGSLINALQTQNKNKYTWQQREQIESATDERRVIIDLDSWTDEKIFVQNPRNIKPASRAFSQSQRSNYTHQTSRSQQLNSPNSHVGFQSSKEND